MPLRLRKFIGAIALFVLVIVWALVAMALAQMPAIRDNAVVSVAYYVIAGLGWVLPAMPRLDEPDGSSHQVSGSGGDAPDTVPDYAASAAAEAVPHRRRRAGQQHAHVAHPLVFAVERNARQRGQVLARARGKSTPGRVVTAVLKPSSAAISNSRGPAEVGSPNG